jgi:hypothetical protein
MALQTFDGTRWNEYVMTSVCPDFQEFGGVVKDRILPVFDGIKEEADAVRDRRYQELMSQAGSFGLWADDIVCGAEYEGAAHYEMLTSMRCATLNLYSAALYHLTEQHLVDLRLRILESYDRSAVPLRDVFRWFKDDLGLDITSLHSWPIIDELRLVANVIKHAEGDSAKELEARRVDLFQLPQFKNLPGATWKGRRVRKPLFGQEISIQLADFEQYHAASVSFWTELADALPGLTR